MAQYTNHKDIWDVQRLFGGYVVVPTNGDVKRTGEAVMGAGLAEQAARRYPALPVALGKALKEHGNQACFFFQFKLFTFPTKHHWHDASSDLNLICKSATQLVNLITNCDLVAPHDLILMPHVGCGKGTGQLPWDRVAPFLAVYLRPLIEARRLQIVDRNPTPAEADALDTLVKSMSWSAPGFHK